MLQRISERLCGKREQVNTRCQWAERRPQVGAIEGRQLTAADIGISGGVLEISGTPQDDTIVSTNYGLFGAVSKRRRMMKTVKMAILAAVTACALQQVACAEPTGLQAEAMHSCVDAYVAWRDAKNAAGSGPYKDMVTSHTTTAYLWSVYTYYGYNIRTNTWGSLSAYDEMWVWTQIAEDADSAYQAFADGVNFGYIPWNSATARALSPLWEAKNAAEAAADEAFYTWWDSFSW
jgi:hypothetical protein